MIILLGSRAARAWFPEFREPKDWDAVASLETIYRWSQDHASYITSLLPASDRKLRCRLTDGTQIEFETLTAGTSAEVLADLAGGFLPCPFPGGMALAASPTVLYLTKRSHVTWPIRWEKNIADLHWLKNRAGTPSVNELAYYEKRRAEHAMRFGQRKVNLDVSNEDFFKKSERIGRIVEHDDLHRIVAYEGRPLFETFKSDLSKAILDRKLFERASFERQLRLVREEAMVIALERYIIPKLPDHIPSALAYSKALKRICTTLTSGWFREFAIDHWPLLQNPDKDFVKPVLEYLAQEAPLCLNRLEADDRVGIGQQD